MTSKKKKIVAEIPPPGPEREQLCERISAKMSDEMGVVNGAPVWLVNRGIELLEEMCSVPSPKRKGRR